MKAKFFRTTPAVSSLTLFCAWMLAGGCSTTTTMTPDTPPKEVNPPEYAYLPHPNGFGTSDIRVLFNDGKAPKQETLGSCDADFRSLQVKTTVVDERTKGVREMVTKTPARYHWCFYSKILELDQSLQDESFVDEKQKKILSVYDFLVPVARAFMTEYRDSRYLRWAIRDYRRLSDLMFYRRLEVTPKTSSELVDVGNPFYGEASAVTPTSENQAVLEKYKIAETPPPVEEMKDEGVVDASAKAQLENDDLSDRAETPPPVQESQTAAVEQAASTTTPVAQTAAPTSVPPTMDAAAAKRAQAEAEARILGKPIERYPASVEPAAAPAEMPPATAPATQAPPTAP